MKQYLLDTNGILRYLLDDIPSQSDSIESYFRQAKNRDVSITVPLLVFVEVDFALMKYYHFSKIKIVSWLGKLVSIPYLDIEKRNILMHAIIEYNHASNSFVDAIFSAEAKLTDKELLTFDQKLRRPKA